MIERSYRTIELRGKTRLVTQRLRTTQSKPVSFVDHDGLATFAVCDQFGKITWTEILRFPFLANVLSIQFLSEIGFLWKKEKETPSNCHFQDNYA